MTLVGAVCGMDRLTFEHICVVIMIMMIMT